MYPIQQNGIENNTKNNLKNLKRKHIEWVQPSSCTPQPLPILLPSVVLLFVVVARLVMLAVFVLPSQAVRLSRHATNEERRATSRPVRRRRRRKTSHHGASRSVPIPLLSSMIHDTIQRNRRERQTDNKINIWYGTERHGIYNYNTTSTRNVASTL